jgi:hypothetical protein
VDSTRTAIGEQYYPHREQETYPVLVIENNGISSGKIDAQPTRSRAEQEQVGSTRAVSPTLELVHLFTTLKGRSRPIDTADCPPHKFACPVLDVRYQQLLSKKFRCLAYLDDVEHSSKLTEQ